MAALCDWKGGCYDFRHFQRTDRAQEQLILKSIVEILDSALGYVTVSDGLFV